MKLRLCGSAADEQLESAALAELAGLEVARRHGELVEVGQEAEWPAISSFAVGLGRFFHVRRDASRRSFTAFAVELVQRGFALAPRDEVSAGFGRDLDSFPCACRRSKPR